MHVMKLIVSINCIFSTSQFIHGSETNFHLSIIMKINLKTISFMKSYLE